MRAEEDKETSGDHLAMMTSMSGFKFAVSFLFNSATEAMATATINLHISLFRTERVGSHLSVLNSDQSYPGETLEHFKPTHVN